MIEIAKSSERLQEPARDLNELYERLSTYMGQVFSIFVPTSGGHKKRAGAFEKLEYIETEGRIQLSYSMPGPGLNSDPSNNYIASLKSVYRVLLDDQWKVVHDGS